MRPKLEATELFRQPQRSVADNRCMSDNALECDLWVLALLGRSGMRMDKLWVFVHETAMAWFERCEIRARA